MKISSTGTDFVPLRNFAHSIGASLRPLQSIVSKLGTIGCILMLLVVSSPVMLNAQTEWKDNYVTLAAEDQTNPSIARPSNTEYTVIVWEDMRDGGKDIYAQKIDNVHGLPQWTPVDGVPVCTASYNQTNPRAAYDSTGHVIIVWEDGRGEDTTMSIFAQCLDVDDGSVVWQTNGIAVCDTSADAMQPRIVGAVDGVYIAWVDWRNNTSVDSNSLNRDIYLQYLYSQTGNWPQGIGSSWISCGVPVPAINAVHDDRNVELARDYFWREAVDGVVLVYESRRAKSATTSDSIFVVYANRFDATGARMWGNQDIRCGANDEAQWNPRVVVLGRRHGAGDSAVVVVWQDVREDPSNGVYDIYGQVLSKGYGTVLGTSSGNEICTAGSTQRYPEISLYERAEDPGQSIGYLARVICVWEDLRDEGSSGIDIYGAIMNGITEGILTPGSTDGDEVCVRSEDQRYPRVDNYLDDPYSYIVWLHDPSSGYTDIWYNDVSLTTLQWTWTQGVGMEVTGAKNDQYSPQVGGDVFVYADHRRQPITYDNISDWNIYAETPGECVGDKYMDWRDMFAEVTTVGDAAHMRFVLDSAFNTFVVWEEPGSGHGEQNVYIQKLDVDGVPRWENSGIRLNTSVYASHPEVTISDSTGGAQVVWHQNDGRTDSVWYAKLSPMGAFTVRNGVGIGKAPVIDYTDLSYDQISGMYFSSAYHAYIGYVDANRKVTLAQWPSGGGVWTTGQIPGTGPPSWYPSTPEGVIIKASLGGGIYGAFYSSVSSPPYITPFAGTDIFSVVTEGSAPYSGGSLKGLDIERDDFGTGTIGMQVGCLVYCLSPTGSTNTDLVSVWLDPSTPLISAPWTIYTATQSEYFLYPALCADNSLNGSWGGMLLAWDHDTLSGGTHGHDVQTIQLMGNGTDWLPSTAYPIKVNHGKPSYALYPDIARIDLGSARGDTAAFVVWEDILEECSPSRPKEVVGDWVLYDTTSTWRGPIWGRYAWGGPKLIGPGTGSYTQTRPMVRTSQDSSVNVFWYDGRGASVLVMGTRVWPVDTTVDWAKEVAEQPPVPTATIRLGESYPNPLSLSRTQVSHVILDVTEETTVQLTLYDNLGRVAGVVYDGVLAAGRHDLRFDVTSLPAGMYHYVLRSNRTTASRGLILLR